MGGDVSQRSLCRQFSRARCSLSFYACRQCGPTILVSKMTELVLKKIALEKENDYLVLDDAGRIIGRIMIRARSPTGRPWVWTITAREQLPSFSNNQGYSETREHAMKDFKAQYSALRFIASQRSFVATLFGTK